MDLRSWNCERGVHWLFIVKYKNCIPWTNQSTFSSASSFWVKTYQLSCVPTSIVYSTGYVTSREPQITIKLRRWQQRSSFNSCFPQMPTQRWKRSNEKRMNDELKDCHYHVSTTSHLQFLRSCTHPSLHPKPSFQASKRHLRLVEEAYKILAWPYSSCLQEVLKMKSHGANEGNVCSKFEYKMNSPFVALYVTGVGLKVGSLGWNRSQKMVDVKTCTIPTPSQVDFPTLRAFDFL